MMARTFVERYVVLSKALADNSGASAIVIIDLKPADAEAAAKDLVDWFGESSTEHD
jgi:hypothetical protein